MFPYREYMMGEPVSMLDPLSVKGETIKVSKDLGEKTVVFAFWLNTCDLCIEQMKELRDVIDKNKLGKQVAVYTVARASSREEARMLQEMMDESGLNWPIIADPDLALSKQFVVTIVPAFHIVGKDRILKTRQVHSVHDPIRNMSLEDMLKAVIRGESIPTLEFVEREDAEPQLEIIGKPAPDFTLTDVYGEEFTLSSFEGEKPVMLVFWHPSCPPCIQTMPYLQDHIRTLKKQYDFEVLSLVNIKSESQERDTKAYIQRYDLPFPVLRDKDAAYGKSMNVNNIPAIYFIDKNGDVHEVIGRIKGEINKIVEPIIAQIADPVSPDAK